MRLPGWTRRIAWNPLNKRKRQRRTAKRRKRERRQHRESSAGWARPDNYRGGPDDTRAISYYYPEGSTKAGRKQDLRSGKDRRAKERRKRDRRQG